MTYQTSVYITYYSRHLWIRWTNYEDFFNFLDSSQITRLGWFTFLFVCLFVCLFSRVPEGRMTAVSSRSHASCRVCARTHRSHKATRHAARGRQGQFLTMRYNTGLTAAPASPLYGLPVCKQVLTVLNVA
jgi:hypothetical protein